MAINQDFPKQNPQNLDPIGVALGDDGDDWHSKTNKTEPGQRNIT
jgi:hypothetical protein